MRATLLLPAACLALLAAPAAAQQAAPAPGPVETAPAPAPAPEQPTPQQGMGMHAHCGMFQAPGLRIRVSGISLDLRCAAGDTTEACARTALGMLGIVDHLNGMAQGGDTGQDDNGDQGSGDGDSGGGDNGGGDQ